MKPEANFYPPHNFFSVAFLFGAKHHFVVRLIMHIIAYSAITFLVFAWLTFDIGGAMTAIESFATGHYVSYNYADARSLTYSNPELANYISTLALFAIFTPALIPVAIAEWIIKNWQKKLGGKEGAKAFFRKWASTYKQTPVTTATLDKEDIAYWHDLLTKGAITKEEYEQKKQELL